MKEEKVENIKEKLLTKLLSNNTKESSKRALAMYVVIIIGTLITIVALVNNVDYIYLLVTWLAFAAALLGLSEYNKNVQERSKAAIEIQKEKSKAPKSEEKVVDDKEIN